MELTPIFAEIAKQRNGLILVTGADIANFKPVVRRGVAQDEALYRPFLETLQAVHAI